MKGFALLFRSILTSSIMDEDIPTRWVWCCFIIEMDKDGIVHGTIPALARRWNVSVEDLTSALEALQRPDPDSGCPDEEGRRIIQYPGNDWQVVSYEYYQSLVALERKKQLTRERVQKHRQSLDCNAGALQSVTCNALSRSKSMSKSTSKKEGGTGGTKRFIKPTPEQVQEYLDELGETRFSGQEFVDSNSAKGWVVGKNQTPMKDWKAAVNTWRRFRDKDDGKKPQRVGKASEDGNDGPWYPEVKYWPEPWHPDDEAYSSHELSSEYVAQCSAEFGKRGDAGVRRWPRFAEWASRTVVVLDKDRVRI